SNGLISTARMFLRPSARNWATRLPPIKPPAPVTTVNFSLMQLPSTSERRDKLCDFVQQTPSGFRTRRFGIDPQHVLRAGCSHHHPANFAKVNLDTVQIFPFDDGPVEKTLEARPGEIRDGFFFLAILDGQVDPAIVMFAEFTMKLRDEFFKALSVPCHHFGKQ